jgi:hypothetical protein
LFVSLAGSVFSSVVLREKRTEKGSKSALEDF